MVPKLAGVRPVIRERIQRRVTGRESGCRVSRAPAGALRADRPDVRLPDDGAVAGGHRLCAWWWRRAPGRARRVQIHVHVWAAVILGGLVSVFPAALALLRPGDTFTRHTIATAQMLMGALLIHLTGGRIETHFHVFGSLAILAFYRDWRVLIPATTVVALDHMLRGLFWPESVYGVAVASEWRWVEHAAWVVFEDVFLVIACVRGTQELSEIAVRTAVLEQANRDSARHTIEQGELISRLRLTQQQVEAATRAKSEFVANMSHELRTPLNAIILYSELLQEVAVDDSRSEDAADLGKIQVASKHLLGLINGILDLSKIEAGKMELHLETFDVRAMTDELINTIGAVVRNNNNRLSVSYDDDLQTMHADLTKTRQILFNLLSNAAKFTTNGHVTVQVARRTVGGRDCIEFAVERRRDRSGGGAAAAAVPAIRAGRHVDLAQVRRHRAGPRPGLALLPVDGRRGHRPERPRPGRDVHGAAAGDGGGPARHPRARAGRSGGLTACSRPQRGEPWSRRRSMPKIPSAQAPIARSVGCFQRHSE